MNIFLYAIIFIIGTLFGSFYTLAVYRIPKNIDIIKKHSYCPNCNHKLGFFELIPVLSYIFLGGKCKNCKQKIRIRYLLLEILSGTLFVIFAFLLGIRFETLTLIKIIDFAFIALYLTFVILLAGIDKENRKIEKGVSVYGVIISIMYMIYLYIVGDANIYRYVIYLVLYILLLILDTVTLKNYAKDNYIIGILIALITMTIFTNELIVITSIILTLLGVSIDFLIAKLRDLTSRVKKSDNQIYKQISIFFYLAISNIILLILVLFTNYICM